MTATYKYDDPECVVSANYRSAAFRQQLFVRLVKQPGSANWYRVVNRVRTISQFE